MQLSIAAMQLAVITITHKCHTTRFHLAEDNRLSLPEITAG